jgi:60 kDa SS-A/Ro ribonucleoprotein
MSNPFLRLLRRDQTPQSAPIPGREPEMTPNRGGGFAFALDEWSRLDRFLILGTEGPTYYATEREMTSENVESLRACIAQDGPRVVARILEFDQERRAPKATPLIFALALAHHSGDGATKAAAGAAVAVLCRTATHLFEYLGYQRVFGSWLGRSKRRAVERWIAAKPADELAYQLVKYQSRNGWSFRDALRVAHPRVEGEERQAVLRWAVKGELPPEQDWSARIHGLVKIQSATTAAEVKELIERYRLPRECVPTEWLNSVGIWETLLQDMPVTAMIRNLGKMGAVGLLKPFVSAVELVTARLTDADRLRKARIHPIQVLSALAVYRQGHGERGKLTWDPVPQVVDALDAAFQASFQAVEPSNRRFYLGLDVSSSMTSGRIAGVPGLTPHVAEACMALVTLRREPLCYAAGFSDEMRPLPLTARSSLPEAMAATQGAFGRTDCAQPMLDALLRKLEVDVFVVYTDNETWTGTVHPVQALQRYRQATGIPARLIVVGFTATSYSIADPNDPGMLDVVGFDSAAPAVMSRFAAG